MPRVTFACSDAPAHRATNTDTNNRRTNTNADASRDALSDTTSYARPVDSEAVDGNTHGNAHEFLADVANLH